MRRNYRTTLRKIVDESNTVRSCSGSLGVLKEEVWVNEKDEVVKYSLAYVNHTICGVDNGRVIGYDNAHGVHERHRMGVASPVPYVGYPELFQEFLEEVERWRKKS